MATYNQNQQPRWNNNPPKQTITWLPMHQAIDSIGFTTWSQGRWQSQRWNQQ